MRSIATLFGIGHLPKAPGTWASAAAIPLTWGLHALGGFTLVVIATGLVTALGLWAVGQALEGPEDDPSEFVVDELAGMMIALWPLSFGLTMLDEDPGVWPYPGWVLAFLLFRFFDIVKPPPVSWAERSGGALGVMLDDLVAGALAALIATLFAAIAHGWI